MLRLRSDVTLAPIGPEHAEAMYHWVSQPDIARDLGLRQTPSLDKTLAWIARSSQDRLVVARAIQQVSRHVGNVVIDRVEVPLRLGRLSIYIGEPAARGHGVGQTGLYLGLQQAFERLALNKICLTVHAENKPAINAYTQLGFRLEGVLRDEFMLDGQRVNLHYMGLLSEEFRQLTIESAAAAA